MPIISFLVNIIDVTKDDQITKYNFQDSRYSDANERNGQVAGNSSSLLLADYNQSIAHFSNRDPFLFLRFLVRLNIVYQVNSVSSTSELNICFDNFALYAYCFIALFTLSMYLALQICSFNARTANDQSIYVYSTRSKEIEAQVLVSMILRIRRAQVTSSQVHLNKGDKCTRIGGCRVASYLYLVINSTGNDAGKVWIGDNEVAWRTEQSFKRTSPLIPCTTTTTTTTTGGGAPAHPHLSPPIAAPVTTPDHRSLSSLHVKLGISPGLITDAAVIIRKQTNDLERVQVFEDFESLNI
ncbi:hypothetical protein WN51_06071 [Melipona quadrifasciata]|uniref:Uncharacterized protein n=1 Tax=Melipona quadrifasciata TaxID=166423 RepID=A0A0M8ZPC1_9HYME|nr:hypothetical protein WN51_06071 [Melipona quadrifasciata]